MLTVYVLSCEDGETYHKAEQVFATDALARRFLSSQGFREDNAGVWRNPKSSFVYFVEMFTVIEEI